jgi:hypothetical protein
MRYLKTYRGLINEGFDVTLWKTERTDLESEWGITIEDIEDVLLDLSDLSNFRGDCKIKTPSQKLRVRLEDNKRIVIKKITQLIILANIKVTKEEYESIISTIKNRLLQMNIHVEDSTMEHERTKVELGIYFVCLRLMLKSDFELLNRSDIKIRYS